MEIKKMLRESKTWSLSQHLKVIFLACGENGVGKSTLLVAIVRLWDQYAFARDFTNSSYAKNIDTYEGADKCINKKIEPDNNLCAYTAYDEISKSNVFFMETIKKLQNKMYSDIKYIKEQ